MNRLWSPWRSKYIESFSENNSEEKKGCVFCDKLAQTYDEENLIVSRSSLSAIIMNIYPYNSGHLMVVPFAHKAVFDDLTEDESADVMSQSRLAIRLLRVALRPDGFNFGANLGKLSGAGIADHIHFHIVPRWNGDTNFMPVLSETKVISEDLHDTLKKLTEALAGLK